MERSELAHRLFLSTIGSDSRTLALEYHLGLELAEFCTARNLDCPAFYSQAQAQSSGISRLWFHAPFAELSPAAIDPMVRAVTRRRYHQSIRAARQLGVTRLVIHTGFVPMVYFPQWFIQQSVLFWRRFLQHTDSILIALENVMEPDPTVQLEIVRQVDDPACGFVWISATPTVRCHRRPWLSGLIPSPPGLPMSTCTITMAAGICTIPWARAALPWSQCWITYWTPAPAPPLPLKINPASPPFSG